MVFSFFGFFSSPKPKPNLERFLRMLWLSNRPEWVSKQIEYLTETDKGVPVLFLTLLNNSIITPHTSEIIKNLLITYSKPEWNVCLQVSKMLSSANAQLELVCVLAIGSEKSTYNREFYHKIRVLKTMEIGAWRKYLTNIKTVTKQVFKEYQKTIDYTLVLFNEPLNYTSKNPSKTQDIISLYKGNIYKNKIMRTPIEVSLDTPFEQRDLHLLVDYIKEEPVVIITKTISENVIPPSNVFVVFMDSSKSYGPNILPYIGEQSTFSLIDLI